MLYVDRVKFRNFKSFKYADIPLRNGFVCLAGPNGSGKSNIIDGLRFAFGELSLKSLRAKRINELITIGADKAEITVFLSGDKRYEIKRAIREDGKTIYKLNGKKTTRSMLIETLRPYGLEESSHNIIAQGQVQRFIDMNSKERREVIDQIAGISEFEEKKEESLKELEKVEQKINDATIVMKEREGMLSQLEKEKDDALKYMGARDAMRLAKASLLNLELALVDAEHTKITEKYLELKTKEEEIKKASEDLDRQISELETEKFALVKEINEKAEREQSGIVREINEIKSNIAVANSTKEAKMQELERIKQKAKGIVQERQQIEGKIKEQTGNAAKLSEEVSALSLAIEEHTKVKQAAAKGVEEAEQKIAELRKTQTSLLKQLDAKRKECSEAELELAKLKSRKELLESELSELQHGGVAGETSGKREKLLEEEAALKQELSSVEGDIERLFQKEKELNKRLPEVEKRFLEARDKFSSISSKLAVLQETSEMKAVEAVLSLRDRGLLKGVHGTVGELCKFPEEYATAIEASAGNRLNFIIVDNVDIAAKAIAYLKERKLGRCTFIPLDKKPFVFSQEARELSKKEGSNGFLLHHVEFNPMFSPAYEYVFGDTLLVDSISAAKSIGVGKIRMVTLEGELFESSGIVTGGSFVKKAGLKEKAEAERLRKEVDALKAEREEIMSSLESVREEMNRRRKERSELEVKLKSVEIELKHISESEEKEKAMRTQAEKKAESIRAQLAECERNSAELEQKLARLKAEAKVFEDKVDAISKELEVHAGPDVKKKAAEADKLLADLEKKRSAIEAKIAGINAEMGVLKQRLESLAEEEKALKSTESSLKEKLKELEERAASDSKRLVEKEEELKTISSSLAQLYEKRNAIEAKIEELAKEKGKRSHGFDKFLKQLAELDVKKATLATRLADLKAESANYSDIKPVEGTKEEFEAKIKECEAVLAALGNVNLKAPETYEEMKRTIEEIKERISKLAEEKLAVKKMIEEIDTRKKDVFMEAFHKLNENFRKLYSHTVKGEATFVLENPANPFEGGLSIKIKDETNKEKYLESMSGGEKALLSVLFVFAIQMSKPAPFYILDEADAALDKANSLKLSNLLKELSKTTQFIVVTHNDQILSAADIALGVTKTAQGSKIVGIELKKGGNGGEHTTATQIQSSLQDAVT